MRTVRFPAASKEYDVIIGNGAVSVLGAEAKKLCPGALKALIVSETNVAPLYLDRVKKELEGAGFEVTSYVFEAGEKSKGIEAVAAMWNKMAEAGFTRTDIVIGLGGAGRDAQGQHQRHCQRGHPAKSLHGRNLLAWLCLIPIY